MLLFLERWGELKIGVDSVKDWPTDVWKIAELPIPKITIDVKILVTLEATVNWWILRKSFSVKFGVHLS